MSEGIYRFGDLVLDVGSRRLLRGGDPVELNARYFDALVLLVRQAGGLVSKERFLEEVWRGVPVTDEALTQCIKTLRRQLGDDAADPRFIATVPKHGYRFIADVEHAGSRAPRRDGSVWRRALLIGGAGIIGGGITGVVAGLFYGFAAAAGSAASGPGSLSVLLVLVCLAIVAALIGAVGVASGIAAATTSRRFRWYLPVLGGAAGGLLVGASAKLLGIDAFALLLGHSPGDITGAAEGAAVGAALGLATAFARGRPLRLGVAAAALAGGAAGLAIALLGGSLLAGSLDAMARQFPASRLRLDAIGATLGEAGLGPISRAVTGTLEGLLFGACVVGAMLLAQRQLDEPSPARPR